MNTARIVVLANAVGAGGIAAHLGGESDNAFPPTEPVAVPQSADVRPVKPGEPRWQIWPAATASSSFIRRNGRPNATTPIPGSIARASSVRCGISSSTMARK